MLCIVLLFTAASADTRVYEIRDTNEIIAGLYVQTEEPQTFQQFGGHDEEGYFLHIYKHSSNPTMWKIGDGKNMKRINDSYMQESSILCTALRRFQKRRESRLKRAGQALKLEESNISISRCCCLLDGQQSLKSLEHVVPHCTLEKLKRFFQLLLSKFLQLWCMSTAAGEEEFFNSGGRSCTECANVHLSVQLRPRHASSCY